MFEVKAEGLEPLQAKIAQFHTQIRELHDKVPQELLAWQTEDMRRTYPNMTTGGSDTETTASTLIWPRSRLSEDRKTQPKKHEPKRYRVPVAKPMQRSARPILRTVLLEKLWECMRALGIGAMKWP